MRFVRCMNKCEVENTAQLNNTSVLFQIFDWMAGPGDQA